MKSVIDHYDRLIEENNDPARDPKSLRDYMDRWDGPRFIDRLRLDSEKTVLEIGVGTGRLALRVAPRCKKLIGIDVSPKTIQRARENLSSHSNVSLICDDFTSFVFGETFDVIYSSLTFMHIANKASASQKIAALLNKHGCFVLSIDKNQSDVIDMGTRKIKIYPDHPDDIRKYLSDAKLVLIEQFETDHAYITVGEKT